MNENSAVSIAIKRGRFKGKCFTVDAEDYTRVSAYEWRLWWNGYTFYPRATIDGKRVTLHEFLMGSEPGAHVDHRDRNGLNACRSNLRFSTSQQNNQNRGKARALTASSQYKGVNRTPRGKWRAQIRAGRSIFLGHFNSEEAAARTYDAAARRLFGEFAVCNFPDPQVDLVRG